MKKNQTLSIDQQVLIDMKKAVLDESNNLSAVTERLYKNYLEEKKMKKYRVETVEYEKDLQTLKHSWTELETDDKEEAIKCFDKLRSQIHKGGVIINEWEDASQDYVWMDEYNLEKSLIMKTWEEENYEVVEQEYDYDLHKFEVYQDDELIGTIYPDNLDDQVQIKKHLDNHVNVNGWETNDGEGGEITLK